MAMNEYHLGEDIRGRTKAAVRGDFAALASHLFSHVCACPLTAAEYHGLSRDIPEQKKRRDAAKSVAYITPGTFAPGAPRRAAEVTGISLVACDLDHDVPAALATREGLAERLAGVNWFAYHSLSSTPEDPRVRVLVDVIGANPADYAAASRAVHARLGIVPNRESLMAHQAMYLPTVFADRDPVFDSPVIGWVDDAAPMVFTGEPHADPFEALPPEPDAAPFEALPATPPSPAQSSKDAKAKKGPRPKEDAVPSLPPARRAVRARHYLCHLPADLAYEDWLTAGMAVHHEFRGSEEGFRLFLDWSREGKKFAGEDDCRAKWRSFDNPERPVTIGSLVALARREGAPLWTESDWCAEWRVNPKNGDFAHVVPGRQFRDRVTPQNFDRENNPRRGDDKRPASEVFYTRIKENGIFHGWGYDPTKPFGAQVDEVLVNKYQAHVYPGDEPTEEELADFGDALRRQLAWMFKTEDREHVDTIINWMACVVQARRIRWALYLVGTGGVGKSTLGEIMRAAVGPENHGSTRPQAVASRFNTWADGKQLVVVEEAQANGEARGLIANVLKPLITNDEVEIEGKGKDSVKRTNFAAFMVFTNHHGVMAFDRSERRYLALECRHRTPAERRANAPLFDTLKDRFVRDRPQVVREWFMRYEIPDTFEPRYAPAITSMLREAIEDEEYLSHAVEEVLSTSQNSRLHPRAFWLSELLVAVQRLMGGERVRAHALSSCLRDKGFERIPHRPRVGSERPTLWAARGLTLEDAMSILDAKAAGGFDPLA